MTGDQCRECSSLLSFKNRDAFNSLDLMESQLKEKRKISTFHLLTVKMQSGSAAGGLLFPRSINGSPDFNKH